MLVAADVAAKGLRLSSVTVDLHDVRLDRTRLVTDQEVDLRSIGRGEATAEITQADLRTALAGIPVPAITIPKLPLLPCVTQAVSRPGRLQLSCAVDQVPEELLRRANTRL